MQLIAAVAFGHEPPKNLIFILICLERGSSASPPSPSPPEDSNPRPPTIHPYHNKTYCSSHSAGKSNSIPKTHHRLRYRLHSIHSECSLIIFFKLMNSFLPRKQFISTTPVELKSPALTWYRVRRPWALAAGSHPVLVRVCFALAGEYEYVHMKRFWFGVIHITRTSGWGSTHRRDDDVGTVARMSSRRLRFSFLLFISFAIGNIIGMWCTTTHHRVRRSYHTRTTRKYPLQSIRTGRLVHCSMLSTCEYE